MRSDSESITRLTELGLTPNEGRIYVALLRSPLATAAELAELAGVSRPKTYAALDSLEQRGFCAVLGGTVTRFRPIDPEPALRAWVVQRDHERELASEREGAVATELTRLLPAAAQAPQESGFLESVSGRARTTEVLEELVASARHRLLMVQQPPYLQPPSRWNVAEIDAVRRGVDVHVLYSEEALGDERRYRALADAGGAVRVLGAPPMKLVLRDTDAAMIALRDQVTGDQGVTSAVIRHPDLVEALALLFDKEWREASKLTAGRSKRGA
jgi:sugar-specific transcriptional regulator TrmB